MSNEDNIPGRLLNHFSTPSDNRTRMDSEALNSLLLSLLIDMPESAFKWNEQKQVYEVRVAGYDIKLRKSSYNGLKYMRKLKNG